MSTAIPCYIIGHAMTEFQVRDIERRAQNTEDLEEKIHDQID